MSTIKGLLLLKNVINESLRKKLLIDIESQDWSLELTRRVQHYGFKYDYSLREPSVKKLVPTTPIPDSFMAIAKCLYDVGLLPFLSNQVIVNEYEPGQGIGKHRDHHPIFKDGIATLTLEGTCVMDFESRAKSLKKESIFLEPGDLIVMRGDARYEYTHEIKKRSSDKINGKTVKRGKRISITFRTH